MKPIFIAIFAALTGVSAAGATDLAAPTPLEAWQADPTLQFEAAEVSLEEFQWLARPIVIFSDTAADPRFREQMDLLLARPDELAERDVVVITDTAPQDRSDIRKKLRPRGFMIVLIGKDGGVKLRKPFPWDVRELTRQIDKMPLRQQEIRAEAE
jgi:hypothetical protein